MRVYREGYYGTGKTVISLTMHKSIYRRMYLRLEIDFMKVYREGYYGTGIGGTFYVRERMQQQQL